MTRKEIGKRQCGAGAARSSPNDIQARTHARINSSSSSATPL